MAKVNGNNIRLYVQGDDLSGDANSLDGIGYSSTMLDVTTLDVTANKRITGLGSGTMGVSVWFDAAAGRSHALFTANSGKVPTTDQNVLVPMGSAEGDPSIHMVAKIANYDVDTGVDTAVSASASFESSTYTPQFGVMLTSHQDTHASTTSGGTVDSGASSSSGGSAVLQVFSLSSGTADVKIQHSTNGSAWTDLISFTAVTTSPNSEYVAVTGTVNRYLRCRSTNTFTNLVFAVDFARD